ncbi:hypothetical protein [Nostoc sp.]|uniref:hypothetical protein n=1 Tax=Nostoc sp. TaxID=1180 RepID=UPI002FF8A9D4
MKYGELNVVISPAFLFIIGNDQADSGLFNLIAEVAISINKAAIALTFLVNTFNSFGRFPDILKVYASFSVANFA